MMCTPNHSRFAVRCACIAVLAVFTLTDQAGSATLRGTVVDREGKPAAGAKVWAAKIGFMEPLERHEATADSAGAFSIETGSGTCGVFALRGREGGQVDWDGIPHVEAGKDPAPVSIRLGAPTNLKGRLLDAETGKPITQGTFALNDARRLEVDAEGRFDAPGIASTNHEAYPVCPGYERRRILFDTTGRPDAVLELKLPKAGKIIGRVVDENGKPIPGATVGLRTSGSIFSGSALWEKCAEDGTFSYDGKSLGRTGRLSARGRGYQDMEREDVVVLDPATPARVDFTLRPDPTKGRVSKAAAPLVHRRNVSGKVVGPDGKPVIAAVVRWDLRVSSDSVPETKTDAEGTFRLQGVPDAENVLSVMSKGLAPSFPLVEAGGDRTVMVELKAGVTIRGRVVDDSGAPIEGARVAPRINNPKPNWGGFVYLDEHHARTDPDGRFQLEGVPPGVACDIIARERSAVRARPLSVDDESKNVFTLLDGGAIRGRVVDFVGNPVRNFRVQVGIPKGAKAGEPVGGYFAGYGGTGLAFTRDDGEFTISGLTAGNFHRLTVIADGLGSGEVDRVEAQPISRLNPADALKIQLQAPRELRVRVFQAKGKPVEGARVTIIQHEGAGGFQWGSYSESTWADSVSASADAQGWAAFTALAFGKGIVIVRAKGFARAKADWEKSEEELNVFLEPEAKLSGHVLDDAGKPFPGSRVMLSWGTGESMMVPIDEHDGRFAADGLGAGNYQLNVLQAAGGGQRVELVELKAGAEVVKDLRVAPRKPAPEKAQFKGSR